MDLSIILSTYRRTEILAKTLESFAALERGGLDWEVWVADNAADPETARLVERFHDRLPVRSFAEPRRGKNFALNNAVERSEGDLVIFTDDDVLADGKWLIETREGAARWPDHAVFAGRIVPGFPGGAPDFPLDEPVIRSAYVIADWNQDEGPLHPSRVWGPNMCVRRKLFDEGWRFTTDLYPVGDDYVMFSETDLAHRLDAAGFPAIYLPRSLVRHQIRPEQMTRRWLYRRAFRYGRAETKYGGFPECPLWFGAPRHIYRSLIENGAARLLAMADREKSLLLGIEGNRLRGSLVEWREESRRRKRKE